MLPRGRPPGPGTAEEKAAIRREKVRLNVKAYRERKKNAALAAASDPSSLLSSSHVQTNSTTSAASSIDTTTATTSEEEQHQQEEDNQQMVVRSRLQAASKSRQSNAKATAKTKANTIQQWSAKTALCISPDSGPMFAQALLSVFRAAFLPHNVVLPSVRGEGSILCTPCSPWIMNAYNMAMQQDYGALKSGLVACGLVLSAAENSDSGLKVASLKTHRQALNQLRNDLVPITVPDQRKGLDTGIFAPYLACLSVAMYELIQNGFSPVILQHVKALNSLIEIMYTDPNIDRFQADLIIEDFGMLEMMFCLKFGFASVLKNTRRKLRKHQRDKTVFIEAKGNASVYGDLLDVIEDLPGLIVQEQTIWSRLSMQTTRNEIQHIVRRLLKIQDNLDAWKTHFELFHGSIMVQERSLEKCISLSIMQPQLRSYEHGTMGLYQLTFLLFALDTNIKAISAFSAVHSLQNSRHQPLQTPVTKRFETGSNPVASSTPEMHSGDTIEQVAFPKDQKYPKKGFLLQLLMAQRVKTRSVIIQLVDVMEQFLLMAFNVSGQSLLVIPSEKVAVMLPEEQQRLNDDLRELPPGDHERATEVGKYLKDLADASNVFDRVQSKLQQAFSSNTTET